MEGIRRWRISCVPEARVRIPAGLEGEKRNELWMKRGLKGGGKEKAHGDRICIRQSNLGLLYLIGCPQACLPLPRQSTSPYFSSTLLFASLLHLIAVFLPPLLHCSLFSLYYYILSSSFLTFLLLFVINIMGGGGEGGVCNFIWGMESNILAAYFFKPCWWKFDFAD